MSWRQPTLLGALWLTLTGAPMTAQSLGLVPERDLPAWLTGWSALAPRTDFPRRLPGSGTALPALLWPAPQVGLFWTAANPAGLVEATREPRTDFFASVARERGTYRRPLDPGGRNVRQLAGQSWGPLGDRFALLGRVAIDQETANPGAQADEIEAYPSSPFPTADTATSATRQTGARLEGAAGWQLRDWSLGITLGYEARDRETTAARLVRRTGLSGSAVILGLGRRLGAVRFGVHGGYRDRSETINIFERTERGQVVQFEGYRDVRPIDVSRQNPYYRRIDGGESWGGVGVEHSGDRTRWVAFAERSRLRERRTRQQQDNPALDRWEPTGWSAGGGASRQLGRHATATVSVRWRSLRGRGTVALDTTGFQTTADEESATVEGELRRTTGNNRAAWALGIAWWYQHRNRVSSLPDLAADVKSVTPTVWAEIAVPLGGRLLMMTGGSFSKYGAASVLPDPRVRGLVYQRFLAPELDIAARAASPLAFKFGFQYQAAVRTRVWIASRVEQLSPSGSMGPTQFGPSGKRTVISAVLGASVATWQRRR